MRHAPIVIPNEVTDAKKNSRVFQQKNQSFDLHPALSQPLHSEPRDLARVLQLQFFFDVGAMRLHRFRTNAERLRNFAHFVSFADQFEDFEFAIR